MHIVIHTSHQPLLTRILPTWHFTILTNQVCRIGLIRMNICPNSNIINKTGIIITTIHRASGDTATPSHFINNLTNIQLHILLIKINL